MAKCENLVGCLFLKDKKEKAPAETVLYLEHYCKSDKTKCARYMVAKTVGKEYVPLDLFPHHVTRARNIITIVERPA